MLVSEIYCYKSLEPAENLHDHLIICFNVTSHSWFIVMVVYIPMSANCRQTAGIFIMTIIIFMENSLIHDSAYLHAGIILWMCPASHIHKMIPVHAIQQPSITSISIDQYL